MPRSATGRSTKPINSGFTLIELLAVIAIMAVLTGLVVLSTGDGGREREIRQEAERLSALIHIAREEVMLGASEVGVAFTRHGYHFQRQQLVNEQTLEWRDITADGQLRSRSLIDQDLELELSVEGRRVRLETDPEHPDPNVFLEGSGEVTPFELTISDTRERDRGVRISGEMDGTISLERIN
ncbi:type II secretion system minor pseudopilin GspH [Halorhodospira halochloris]|uniref:type II secretion system minor pseudopilin GspH n=1 Tax=Halorhodospira halochloris TaxID=1052 RepID=UPI001EE7F2E7|nr:type II secretion system minor pseudopilin GspH [Halorhodospira halochloris]MCG5529281.1 type II secretion system minor pseudopilin GspH [Halorhodospira halochloris]